MGKDLSKMTLEELWELFPIILREHNPEYAQWYLEEKKELLDAIGHDTPWRMNHIGSTAVQGLVAKPTVDILLEIHRDIDVKELDARLAAAGWNCMSSQTEPELNKVYNKGYTPDGFADRVFHLHVRNAGDWNELYFRDYLIAHPETAEEYGRLKLDLKEKYEHNRDGYTHAKSDMIIRVTNEARREFGNRYIPQLQL